VLVPSGPTTGRGCLLAGGTLVSFVPGWDARSRSLLRGGLALKLDPTSQLEQDVLGLFQMSCDHFQGWRFHDHCSSTGPLSP